MKATYREACCGCKEIQDVKMGTMSACVMCKELVCIQCAVVETDAIEFMNKTKTGKVFKNDPHPDIDDGPAGWVCPSCFKLYMTRAPRKVQWTENSPSSGETQ